jgi:uncharacterized damage-inducible protein DinB
MKVAFALLLIAPAFSADLKSDYLFQFDVTSSQILDLAKAMPSEKFEWRPGAGVRSVGEVYVHIAEANVLLVGFTGQRIDFAGPHFSGKEPGAEIVDRNLQFEKTVHGKETILAMLHDTIHATRASFAAADLEKPASFLGRPTTVRGIYIVILAHMNEHLGQSIAYARMNGVVPPWSK